MLCINLIPSFLLLYKYSYSKVPKFYFDNVKGINNSIYFFSGFM